MTDVNLINFSYNSPHGTTALIANLTNNIPENDYRFDNLIRKIPNEYVYHKYVGKNNQYDKYGKTDVPHITIAMGMNRYSLFKMMDELESNVSPFFVTVGTVNAHRITKKPYDILYLDVKSPEMEEIYKWLRETLNASKNAGKEKLNPHITLSYILKGSCKELEGKCNLTGSKLLIKNLEFRDLTGHSYMIKLGSRMRYQGPKYKTA